MSTSRIFRYLKTSTDIIRLAVMTYGRYTMSPRSVALRAHQERISISHQSLKERRSCRVAYLFAA